MEDMRKKGELLDVSLCSNDATLVPPLSLALALSLTYSLSLLLQRRHPGPHPPLLDYYTYYYMCPHTSMYLVCLHAA